MTARESINENLRGLRSLIKDDDVLNFYYDLIDTMLKEYAREKCAEQRELCVQSFNKTAMPLINGATVIREAPEPNFD